MYATNSHPSMYKIETIKSLYDCKNSMKSAPLIYFFATSYLSILGLNKKAKNTRQWTAK